MAASRLIHYVSKTHRNAYGVFAEASDDLGDLKIPNVPPMIQMAYAYARRAAAAGLYYQNIFTRDQYMQIYTVFLAYQHSTGQSVDFQEEAFDQAIEFLQSYDNRITKQVVWLMVTGVETAGSNNVPPGAPINSVEKVFSMIDSATNARLISLENNLVDVQTALVRCFQFLEEKRFDEAHVIIEQILNIDPNNTDAHIANFLYQFRCGRIDWLDCNRYKDYLESVFYHRICNSKQTSLKTQFISSTSEMQKKFEAERKWDEYRRKNGIQKGKEKKKSKEHSDNGCFVMLFLLSSLAGFLIFHFVSNFHFR